MRFVKIVAQIRAKYLVKADLSLRLNLHHIIAVWMA